MEGGGGGVAGGLCKGGVAPAAQWSEGAAWRGTRERTWCLARIRGAAIVASTLQGGSDACAERARTEQTSESLLPYPLAFGVSAVPAARGGDAVISVIRVVRLGTRQGWATACLKHIRGASIEM